MTVYVRSLSIVYNTETLDVPVLVCETKSHLFILHFKPFTFRVKTRPSDRASWSGFYVRKPVCNFNIFFNRRCRLSGSSDLVLPSNWCKIISPSSGKPMQNFPPPFSPQSGKCLKVLFIFTRKEIKRNVNVKQFLIWQLLSIYFRNSECQQLSCQVITAYFWDYRKIKILKHVIL